MTTSFDGVEVETGPQPQWTVIWLHGLGADGHDFEPIVPELVEDDWPAIRFVFPHAPVRAVTINGGVRMRAWYDILGLEIAQRQDETGVRESIAFVRQLVARENARGIPSERIVIAGFSQGGAIALAASIRHPERLGGVVALSTYLPIAESSGAERSEANRSMPVFMAHGSLDPVVGHALGQMSHGYLQNLGYTVDWHSYPMPHSVNAEEIADLATWLGRRFASASN
jgi:phospholipase/carboxylesterase